MVAVLGTQLMKVFEALAQRVFRLAPAGMQEAHADKTAATELQEVRLWALLVGVLVLGGTLFLFVRLVSRYMRRQLQKSRGRSRQGPDNWAARRLLHIPPPQAAEEDDSKEPPSNGA